MEQMPINFEDAGNLESLSTPELETLYRKKVGKSSRGWNKETLIRAINNPKEELDRIGEIDRNEDRKDLAALYRR